MFELVLPSTTTFSMCMSSVYCMAWFSFPSCENLLIPNCQVLLGGIAMLSVESLPVHFPELPSMVMVMVAGIGALPSFDMVPVIMRTPPDCVMSASSTMRPLSTS